MYFIYNPDLEEVGQWPLDFADMNFSEQSIAMFAGTHPNLIYFEAELSTDHIVEEDVRTNPDTCMHWVVRVIWNQYTDGLVTCVSCDATISDEFWNQMNYKWSDEHEVWEHQNPRKKE